MIEAMLAPYRGGGRLHGAAAVPAGRRRRPTATGSRRSRVAHRDSGDEIDRQRAVRPRRDRDRRPAAADRHRVRHRLRVARARPASRARRTTAQPANMQAVVGVLRHRPRRRRPHHRQAGATTTSGATYQPAFWGDRLLSFRAPDPRTLEIVDAHLHPEPGRRPARGRRRPAASTPATATCGRSAASPPAATSPRRLRQRHLPGQLADDRLLRGADHRRARTPSSTSRRRGELSQSVLYWLQTEAPRADGGTGFPGLRLRGDVTGTRGRPGAGAVHPRVPPHPGRVHRRRAGPLARRPRRRRARCSYARHRRRRHVPHRPAPLDRRRQLHRRRRAARSRSRSARCIPQRIENLLPAGKNIGTTHITNGCYRLHPVEWNIGEVAGALAAFCLDHAASPRARCATPPACSPTSRPGSIAEGVELRWPDVAGY